FPASIFEIVLKGLTVRGSIVGTRHDMEEAIEFYERGLIHPTVSTRNLSEINAVLDEMKHGKIDGRVVIKY
ncbi:MAG: alcohol dehydrogenase, propanol-preferring, partial [Actinomycetota bacterium]|nr:alcohol dehydrogenase, propanol-preferring [Actinomycetota bacterium]